MSTGDDTGVIRSVPPTGQAGTAHDAGTNTPAPAEVTVPAGSNPPTSTSVSPPASPAEGSPAPASPPSGKPEPVADPVQAAIDRLARPDSQPRDDKGRFANPDPAQAGQALAPAAKPGQPAKPPATPAAAAPAKPGAPTTAAASQQGVEVDPFHGFDERERAAFKGKTRERVEDLHHRWREEATKRTELETELQKPDEFQQVIQQFELDNDVGFVPPQHLAGLVKSQAAVTRALISLQQNRRPADQDVEIATGFFERIDEVREQLGLGSAAAATIEPFQGQLPQDMADLVSVYGLDEADVRMLAAIKAKGTGAATSTAPRSQPPAPVRAPAPPVPAARPQQPQGVDMEQLYGQRLASDLVRDGVSAEMTRAHYQVILPIAAKIVQQRFPTLPPDRVGAVFDALPPKDRYDILVEAHREHRKPSVSPPARSSTPPPPATTHASFTGSAPRASAASPSSDPVVNAINLLARQ